MENDLIIKQYKTAVKYFVEIKPPQKDNIIYVLIFADAMDELNIALQKVIDNQTEYTFSELCEDIIEDFVRRLYREYPFGNKYDELFKEYINQLTNHIPFIKINLTYKT